MVGAVTVVVWLAEGTWEACVDAVPGSASDVLLVHVADVHPDEFVDAGLFGRGQTDPGAALAAAADAASAALFTAALARLGRPARTAALRGRVERAVVAACDGASLLVLARDGDHSRLGPASLAPPTRFVVDHAPCRVLLVWPDEPPDLATIPPPPRPGPGPGPRKRQPR
jgi:nucleotide-binding universal stress UspA family protein